MCLGLCNPAITYVMGATPSRISQLLRRPQCSIKSVALILRTRVLPVRTERVAKRAFSLPLCTTLELLNERLSLIQSGEQCFRVLTPEHCAMLHTSTRDSLDLGEVGTLLLQSLQDKINGFEPQSDRREDLAFGGVGENTLVNSILGEIGIEVDFGFLDEFEVGSDDDS